jgi:hypothetical protein
MISTDRAVSLLLNESRVRSIFSSSLYAGITIDTSGAPLYSLLYCCCTRAVFCSLLLSLAFHNWLMYEGIAIGRMEQGYTFSF